MENFISKRISFKDLILEYLINEIKKEKKVVKWFVLFIEWCYTLNVLVSN